MEHHGTNPASRWRVLRERIEAMKTIWTQDVAEYHGEFVNFAPLWQWPKPVQKPHPPILVGGDGARTLQRVMHYGDGWMPVGRRGDFTGRIAELQRLAAETGRAAIPVSIFGAPPKPEVIEQYARAGVERVIFTLPPAPAPEVLPLLRSSCGRGGTFSLVRRTTIARPFGGCARQGCARQYLPLVGLGGGLLGQARSLRLHCWKDVHSSAMNSVLTLCVWELRVATTYWLISLDRPSVPALEISARLRHNWCILSRRLRRHRCHRSKPMSTGLIQHRRHSGWLMGYSNWCPH